MISLFELRIPLYRIVVFAAIILLASCQKELSFETPADPGDIIPPDSLATFSFVPSGNNCSDATTQGILQKDVPLSAAKITVSVNVTKKGKWIMSTTATNGISFAGAGAFSTTGIQVITLTGSGTPTTVGVSQIPLKAGSATCSVSVTVTDGSSTTTGDYYYKAVIGGVSYAQYATYDNGFIPGSGLGGTDEVNFSASIDYDGDQAPAGTTGFYIEKGIMSNYLSASDAQFKAFFPIGDLTYAPKGSGPQNGIVIGWTDPDGQFWTTNSGTGDQTGSTFKIISVTDSYDVLGTYYIEVKMQFECTLYNSQTGDEKKLTNGEMVGLFGKI
ncbi:MAG: hypothetical protein KF862_02070 [Chitinophagaceae bacterium]|nr:hypothetical protein [Chitinophagaceae bacterium]